MPLNLGPVLRFDMPDFVIRSLVLGDETEEWGGWLANPRVAAMLNAVPRVRTMAELRTYIATFDRRDRHLFGVFEKQTNRLIGIRTIEINRARRSFSVHMLIGDNHDWGQGAMDQSTEATVNWAYETCDLLWVEASVLAINKKMVRYLCDNGYTIVRNDLGQSAIDGKLIDLVFLRRHRDIWRKDHRSSVVTGIPAPTGLESAKTG